jgi:hypothetical protein
MTDGRLQEAIDRVCAADSFYWSSREAKGRAREREDEVEIRLNLPAAALTDARFDGWTVAARDTGLGAVFLRRRQALTDSAVRRLFTDALTLAVQHGGRFHSWVHGDSLPRHDGAVA